MRRLPKVSRVNSDLNTGVSRNIASFCPSYPVVRTGRQPECWPNSDVRSNFSLKLLSPRNRSRGRIGWVILVPIGSFSSEVSGRCPRISRTDVAIALYRTIEFVENKPENRIRTCACVMRRLSMSNGKGVCLRWHARLSSTADEIGIGNSR